MAPNWSGERLETFLYDQTAIEHLHRYAIACHLSAGKDVLDIACGEGYGSALLSRSARKVIAVDIDPETIRRASEKYKRPQLEFLPGDVARIPVTNATVDIVVSFETLEHTDRQEEMLAEIKRVLRPGGLLIISTPDKKNYSDRTGYKNPFHVKELYQQELVELVGRYFSKQRLLLQSYLPGSFIMDQSSGQVTVFQGDYGQVSGPVEMKPVYLLLLASDQSLPVIGSTVFDGSDILATREAQQVQALKNTWTYRAGQWILGPAKWIRGWFR